MIVIGCDPGVHGAAALIDRAGGVQIIDLPSVERGGTGQIKRKLCGAQMYEMLHAALDPLEQVLFAFEDVGTLGGDKAAAIQGSLQYSKAVIETVAGIARWHVVPISVQEWKDFYRLGKNKKEALLLAKQLYPSAPITLAKHHNRAESLLIAHYALRTKT